MPWQLCGLSGLALFLVLVGCAPQASMLRETATGGVVEYAYTADQDILVSRARSNALELMTRKCPVGYRVLREGEVGRINPALDKAWNGQLPAERRWTIQFECK